MRGDRQAESVRLFYNMSKSSYAPLAAFNNGACLEDYPQEGFNIL